MNQYSASFNEESKDYEDEFNLKFLLNTFTRNRIFIVSFSSFFFLISCFYAFSKKKIWEGQTEIVLKSDQLNNISSLESNLRNIRIPGINIKSPSNSLDTSVGILKSPSVLMPIFNFVKEEKIKIDKNYDQNFTEWREDNLDINLQENTTILGVSYRDNEKNLIIPVLNKLTNAYQLYSGKNKRRKIKLTQDYLKSQIAIFKEKSFKSIKEAQEFAILKNLSPLMFENSNQGNSALTLGDNRFMPLPSNLVLGTNTDIEVMRLNASNQIKEIDIQIEKIKRLDNYNELQYLGSIIPGLQKTGLPKKLQDLEDELANLKLFFTENSIEIKDLKRDRKLLIDLLKNRSIGYLKANRISSLARLESLTRPKDVLVKYKELVRIAARDEKALIELENQLLLSKLEEAQLEDPWELISEPTLKEFPVSPIKKNIAFTGSLIGFFLSYIIVLLKEKRSGLIFESDDLVKLLDTKIIDNINSKNKTLDNFSNEVLINEILLNQVKKIKFITLGISDKYYIKRDLSVIFEDEDNYEILENFNDIRNDDKVILLIKLGNVYFKEINSLKERLIISNKKIFGIITVRI